MTQTEWYNTVYIGQIDCDGSYKSIVTYYELNNPTVQAQRFAEEQIQNAVIKLGERYSGGCNPCC